MGVLTILKASGQKNLLLGAASLFIIIDYCCPFCYNKSYI